MTHLVLPDADRHDQWAAMVLEFGAQQLHGSGSWEVDEEHRGSTSPVALQHLVAALLACGDPAAPRPSDRVPTDYFWIADGEDLVGFIAVRHRLNEFLLERGGHIGFSIRPSRRREGHASRALEHALDHVATLGVERALVTCKDDNVASAHVIERGGGVVDDVRHGERRYWIDVTGRAEGEAARARR
ncbi:MAG: GNAT family N-acetyltransferase [Nocardioides sp.]